MARVLFLVHSLEVGGAERQLSVLAAGLRRPGHEVGVCVLFHAGPYAEQLVVKGVELFRVDKSGPLKSIRFFWRVARTVRRFRPDVLHGYMDDANLLAAVTAVVVPRATIAWGVRNAQLNFAPGE